jgi:hypothetical protein
MKLLIMTFSPLPVTSSHLFMYVTRISRYTGAVDWTPIFRSVIKDERNKLQKKALYFRKVLTI